MIALPARPHISPRQALCFAAAVLLPAVTCTLLTWRLLPHWWELSRVFLVLHSRKQLSPIAP